MSNPEYRAYGSARMRWVEKDEPGEFRNTNEYMRGSRLACITGYYLDPHWDQTAVPAVYIVLNAGDEDNPEYYAAVHDPNNDGCGTVDFEESYSDPSEAARAAHELAKRYAEAEREYSDNEDNKIVLGNLLDDVTELRRRYGYLIRALPETGDDATGARMREEIRMTQLIKNIRELRSQIREI